MKQISKEDAIRLAESEWWKNLDARRIVSFQLFQDKSCMSFSDFHGAVESVLGRPVYRHEFNNAVELRREFLGEKPAPTIQEIIDMIPAAKLILANY